MNSKVHLKVKKRAKEQRGEFDLIEKTIQGKQFISRSVVSEEIDSIARGYSKFYTIIRNEKGVTTLKRKPKAITRYLARKGEIILLTHK